jgi:hypothetical protein
VSLSASFSFDWLVKLVDSDGVLDFNEKEVDGVLNVEEVDGFVGVTVAIGLDAEECVISIFDLDCMNVEGVVDEFVFGCINFDGVEEMLAFDCLVDELAFVGCINVDGVEEVFAFDCINVDGVEEVFAFDCINVDGVEEVLAFDCINVGGVDDLLFDLIVVARLGELDGDGERLGERSLSDKNISHDCFEPKESTRAL